MYHKRKNDELKAVRPTLKEVMGIPRLPISFLVENIRSVHNVGAIFRTADGIGAEKLYLAGYTAYPPRQDLKKVSLGAEESVPWEHFENPIDAAKKIRAEPIVAKITPNVFCPGNFICTRNANSLILCN